MVPTFRRARSSANHTEPSGPQCPAVRMYSRFPSVTLNPAEQRPAVERMGWAPLRRVVKVPSVRSMRTKPPMPSATPVSSDQSSDETVLSPRTTTSLDR